LIGFHAFFRERGSRQKAAVHGRVEFVFLRSSLNAEQEKTRPSMTAFLNY